LPRLSGSAEASDFWQRIHDSTAGGEGSEGINMPVIEDVRRFLQDRGIAVMEFVEPTPNSVAAANAVGCSVGEIAKTILFIIGGRPLVVVTSGDVKVKTSKLKQVLGSTGKARLPVAEEVIRYTGYAPGGVCPFLLPDDLRILVDASMRRFPVVYAAAGNEHSAVPVTVDQLLEITGGIEVEVCE
jgi:prolyl-tRNA editing enzyme YbaK/EbsC (Cys-tRNA(Pro) deacylase)